MDDSNNQDNKKSNSSLEPVHSLFSISVRSLINVSIIEELRLQTEAGLSLEPWAGAQLKMNEDQISAFNTELGLRWCCILSEKKREQSMVLVCKRTFIYVDGFGRSGKYL